MEIETATSLHVMQVKRNSNSETFGDRLKCPEWKGGWFWPEVAYDFKHCQIWEKQVLKRNLLKRNLN